MFSSPIATTPPEDEKPFEPTPTKKAWRRRLQLDQDTELLHQPGPPDHNSLTPPSQASDILMQPKAPAGLVVTGPFGLTSPGEAVPESSNNIGQPITTTRFFACGQCGKCFVSLKYLDMHAAALHSGKSSTGCDFIIVEPTAMASAVSAALGSPVSRRLLPVTLSSSSSSSIAAAASTAFDPAGTRSPAVSGISLVTSPRAALVATAHRPPPPMPLVFRVPVSSPALISSLRYPLTAASSASVAAAAASAAAAAVASVRPVRNNEWKCETCKKTFSQNSSYKNHQRTHSDERPFVCTVCSIGFKERYHLKKHILFKHTDELREECNVCGKRFKDTTAVRAHERIHSDRRPYSCQRCNKAFKTSECLWHHENRSKSCGTSATGRRATAARGSSEATRRIRRPLAPSVLKGPMTSSDDRVGRGTTTMLPTSVSGASNQLHDIVMLFENEMNTAAMVDVIEEESSSATNRPEFGLNLLRHPKEENCTQNDAEPRGNHRDGLVLLANCAVRDPIREMTSSKSDTSTTLLQVKVEPQIVLTDYELTAMTSSESSFYERIREMTSESDLQETDDSKTSSSSSSGDRYQLVKQDGDEEEPEAGVSAKRLECNRCVRQFSSTRAFEKHMVIHSEARPYLCDKCDVGFKLKVHLKKHILYRHSNDYHCSCRHCGKKFKDSSAVRLHERIHSTDRPFGCNICGKTFKTRENLWGHRHRGPCGSASPVVSGGQTSDTSIAIVSATTSQTTTAIDASRWSPAASGQASSTSSPTDDWIAKLLSASAAAARRTVNDVPDTAAAAAAGASKVQSGVPTVMTSPFDANAIMTPAEQQALLNKAILLSKILQSQYVSVGGGRHLMSQTTLSGAIGNAAAATANVVGFGNALPTAVVNPMKRSSPEVDRGNDGLVAGTTSSSGIVVSCSSATPSSSAPLQQLSPMSRQVYAGAPAAKAHLPPIETFRAHHASPPPGVLSQNEAAQTEAGTTSSSLPVTAVNLSLHSSSHNRPGADSLPPAETGNDQQLAGARRISDSVERLRMDSLSSRDHHHTVTGSNDAVRCIAHVHDDVMHRPAVVVTTVVGGGAENQLTPLQHGQGH